MKFRKIAIVLILSNLSLGGYSQINIGTNFNVVGSVPIDARLVVSDITVRNNILWRYEGLSVFVISDQTNYQLRGGTTNSDWVSISTTAYTAGLGITLTGTTFSHPSHSGDVTGATTLTLVALRGRTLAATTPTNGDVLGWNGSAWTPAPAFSNYATGTGLLLSGNTLSALNTSAIWNANQINGTSISTTAPTSTQILRYNGTTWIPTDETAYAAGTGLTLTGTTFAITSPVAVNLGGTGQTSYTDGQILIGNTAGSLTKTTITGGTDISVTNGNGTITIANTNSNQTHTGDAIGAGALTVVALQGSSVSTVSPSTNQFLKWNGTSWTPAAYSAGTGITLSGTTFSHPAHTGDAIGSTSLTVVALQGRPIATTAPTVNDVLKWDNTTSTWTPTNDDAHHVGELYGGGVVFYVDHTGNHGYICSMIDLDGGAGAYWSASASLVGAAARSDWDGQGNTNAIVAKGYATSAAKLCDDYINANYGTGIYTDWYLPSTTQILKLYMGLIEDVDQVLNNDGDPATTPFVQGEFYWTSLEAMGSGAWAFYYESFDITIGGSNITINAKTGNLYHVRAIRNF